MSTAKSIICFFLEHNLPKPTMAEAGKKKKKYDSLDARDLCGRARGKRTPNRR